MHKKYYYSYLSYLIEFKKRNVESIIQLGMAKISGVVSVEQDNNPERDE